MTTLNLLPFFMIGLLGAVHCVGMCGGIVGALSLASPKRRSFPVPVVAISSSAASTIALDNTLRVLAYNTGRIASYMIAGAIAGGISGGVHSLSGMASLQIAAYWMVNLTLVALGLYLTGAWHGLARLEQAGQVVWRRLQPIMKPLLPLDSTPKALALGAVWGWVPCGMVYSVLLAAMLTGSSWSGAAVMLAFGLGTLPALLTMGMMGARLKSWTKKRGVRIAAGLIVLAFGVLGLVRAGNGMAPGWLDAICITPSTGFH